MATNILEIALPLCHMVVTCQILFGCIFDKIKQKTGIKANSTRKLIKRPIKQVGYNNFQKVLSCMSTIDRQGQLIRFVDGIKLFGNICKPILVNKNL